MEDKTTRWNSDFLIQYVKDRNIPRAPVEDVYRAATTKAIRHGLVMSDVRLNNKGVDPFISDVLLRPAAHLPSGYVLCQRLRKWASSMKKVRLVSWGVYHQAYIAQLLDNDQRFLDLAVPELAYSGKSVNLVGLVYLNVGWRIGYPKSIDYVNSDVFGLPYLGYNFIKELELGVECLDVALRCAVSFIDGYLSNI